jgi:hypothetical protein
VGALAGYGSALSGGLAAEKLIGGEGSQAFNLLVNRAQQFLQYRFQFIVGHCRNPGTEMSDSVIKAATVHRIGGTNSCASVRVAIERLLAREKVTL